MNKDSTTQTSATFASAATGINALQTIIEEPMIHKYATDKVLAQLQNSINILRELLDDMHKEKEEEILP